MNTNKLQVLHTTKIMVAGICLCTAILLGSVPWLMSSDHNPVAQAYYYDLITKRVYVDDSDKYAPIEAPSGGEYQGRPAGVRAYIFTCNEQSDYEGMTSSEIIAAGGFIGYIELYSEQAIQDLSLSPDSSRVIQDLTLRAAAGRYVRKVDGDTWVIADSVAGQKIQDVTAASGSGRAKPCRPTTHN